MIKYIIVFLILAFNHISYSQPKEVKPKYLSGSMGISGYYAKGNTNKFYAACHSEIKYTRGIIESILSGQIGYGENNHIKDENDFYGTFTTDIFYDKIWVPFVLEIVEFSHGKGIDIRSQTGGGIKYVFVPFPEHRSSVSAALIYDYTNLANVPGNYDSKKTRFSFRIKTKQILFDGRLIFNHVTYYQPEYKNFKDVIWRSESILELPIVKNIFSVNATYRYAKESVYSVGRKAEDHRVTFGMSVGF